MFSRICNTVLIILLSAGCAFAENIGKQITDLKAEYRQDYSDGRRQAEQLLRHPAIGDVEANEILRTMGSWALRHGKYSTAIGDLTSALIYDDRDWWSLWNRCWSYMELGYIGPALFDCELSVEVVDAELADLSEKQEEEAKQLVKAAPAAFLAYSTLLQRIGETESAIKNLESRFGKSAHNSGERSSFLDDDGSLPWNVVYTLAFMHFDAGNFEESIHYATKALKREGVASSGVSSISGTRAELFNLIGEADLELNRLGSSESNFLAAIKEVDNYADAVYNICSLHLNSEAWGDARAWCEQAASNEGQNDPAAMDAYGLALLGLEEFDAASSILAHALKLDPNSLTLHAHGLIAQSNGELEIIKKLLAEMEISDTRKRLLMSEVLRELKRLGLVRKD